MKLLFLAAILLSSCDPAPKPQPATQTQEAHQTVIVDTSYRPKNFVKEYGSTAKSSSPKIIDLSDRNITYAPFDLADHFKSAKVLILEAPEGDFTYVKDTSVCYKYPKGNMAIQMGGLFPFAYSEGSHIILRDNNIGILHYDSNGKFVETIARNLMPAMKYDRRAKHYEVDMSKVIESNVVKITGNELIYLTMDSTGIETKYWYDLVNKRVDKIEHFGTGRRGIYHTPTPLNDSVSFTFVPSLATANRPLLHMFNPKGDTIATFMNYLKYPDEKFSAYAQNMMQVYTYTLEGKNYFKQMLNDTIFSITSPTEIRAEYLMKLGRYKQDDKSAFWGTGDDFIGVGSVLETPTLLYINYGFGKDYENWDYKKPFYAVWDKRSDKLIHIDAKNKTGNKAFVPNTMPQSLPLLFDKFRVSPQGEIFVCYHRHTLEKLMELPAFKALPAAQQEFTQKIAAQLGNKKLAVMVIQ